MSVLQEWGQWGVTGTNDLKTTSKPISHFGGREINSDIENGELKSRFIPGSFQVYRYYRQLAFYIMILMENIYRMYPNIIDKVVKDDLNDIDLSKINGIKVQEVSDTSVVGWFETSNDSVQPGWWFQNDDVANTYTYNTEELRAARDAELAASDWTQLADSPLTDSKKTEWATYRQSLRDITDSATSLDDVTWPTKP